MKPKLNFLLIGLLILSFSNCEQKETSLNSEVKQYAKFISDMKSKGFMTGNILVYENGEIVFQSSDGLRSIDPKDSLTLNSQFRLASVSKQFTAIAIMKLKQAGSLDYDQKVNTILTDFPYENITIKHLLSHTSGIGDYIEIIKENFIPQDSTKRHIIGNNEVLDIFYNTNPKLNFQPGEEYEYSNTGYLVLASELSQKDNLHGEAFNFGPPAHQNHSVSSLVDEMSKHWPLVKWEKPEEIRESFYESGLLKLNCDKALHLLNWQAMLNFSDTVRLTAEWYVHFYKDSEGIAKVTDSQIIEYQELLIKSHKK